MLYRMHFWPQRRPVYLPCCFILRSLAVACWVSGWQHLQDASADSMQNGGAYRAVLYTCVAAHWATLLTAMHLVGTTSVNPLALLGERWNHHTLLVGSASPVSALSV